MVVSESRDVGMDRALERARTLHTSVGVALHDYRLDPQEMAALRDIRSVKDDFAGVELRTRHNALWPAQDPHRHARK